MKYSRKNESNIVLISLCPKCNDYPHFIFDEDKPKEVLVQCKQCGYNQNIPISNYLNLMNITCKEANENKNQFDLCEEKKLHKQKAKNNKKANSNNEKLQKGFDHINKYCYELKNNKLNDLIEQINQLEFSYQSFSTTNNNILQLLQVIYNCYITNSSNDALTYNKDYIDYIQIEQFNNDEHSINSLIEYYNNYHLIKKTCIDISNIKNIKTIKKHTSTVNSILLLFDGRLASCSDDKTIKIHNIKNNYQCDMIIKTKHSNIVTDICQTQNGKLVSCSKDKTFKIWTIFKTSYECDYIINDAHYDYIDKVISLTNNRMASCSWDKTIRIWNSDSFELIKILEGHTFIVRSVIQLKGKDILLSGSNDNTLRIWNLSTYQCIGIVTKVYCYYKNSMIEIEDNKVIVGGVGELAIVNIEKCIIEKRIESKQMKVVLSLIMLKDNNIICGSDEGFLHLFDKNSHTIMTNSIKAHTRSINSLVNIDEHHFISCSNEIKIWKY